MMDVLEELYETCDAKENMDKIFKERGVQLPKKEKKKDATLDTAESINKQIEHAQGHLHRVTNEQQGQTNRHAALCAQLEECDTKLVEYEDQIADINLNIQRLTEQWQAKYVVLTNATVNAIATN